VFTTILLAYDGSDASKLAMEKAAEMAQQSGAKLHILAGVEFLSMPRP